MTKKPRYSDVAQFHSDYVRYSEGATPPRGRSAERMEINDHSSPRKATRALARRHGVLLLRPRSERLVDHIHPRRKRNDETEVSKWLEKKHD